jgi:hypothetical protein
MITYLINAKNGQRIEVLDQDAQFIEEQSILVPMWSPKKIPVTEIILSTKVEGDATIGYRCSIIQNIFLTPNEKEK